MYRDRNDQSYRTGLKAVGISSASALASELAGSPLMVTVVGLGGYRVVTGHLGTADLIAFILHSEMVTIRSLHWPRYCRSSLRPGRRTGVSRRSCRIPDRTPA